MNYWLSRSGQQQGPYSIQDLQRMLGERMAAASDLVWADGMPGWTPLSNVIQGSPVFAVGGPAGAAPAFEAQSAPPAAGAPVAAANPPSLHWGVVLALVFVTFGLFPLIWLFVQARFAKKLDPNNKATLQIAGSLVAVFAEFLFSTVNALTIARGGEATNISPVDNVLFLFATIFAVSAVFQIRQSLLNYYNNAEPIGLRLNAGLTLFFNVYYFQHHLSRIARWKKTGVLTPQR